MRIFAFLIEPAYYTIQRNKIVYDSKDIKYCYLKKNSEASDVFADSICLEGWSILKKIKFLISVLNSYDGFIFNGYINKEFIILFIFNLYYKKPIGIDSDTSYSIVKNPFKNILKWIYLNFIFRRKFIFGLAGGTKGHFELFSNYGMQSSRIFLMPMMVDNSKFKNSEYLNKPKKPFKFLYVGRFVEHKNILLLLQAFTKVSQNISDVRLFLVGSGPKMGDYQEHFKDQNKILFFGKLFKEDLYLLYKECHVLILPSKYEPWGLVVNEALSAGLPVIASNMVGAAFDLIIKPNAGLIFDCNNENELIRNMYMLYNDNNLYQELSTNGFNLVNNIWNFEFYNNCLDNVLVTMEKYYEEN